VTSYTKWDRDAYIERVGGPEEAERRRKALMARQSGQRLAEERKQRGLTQAQLAETMGVTPGRVSQIERGKLSTVEAIARYVQALGGHLELVANFADHTLTVTTSQLRRPHPHGDHYRSCLTAGSCEETPRPATPETTVSQVHPGTWQAFRVYRRSTRGPLRTGGRADMRRSSPPRVGVRPPPRCSDCRTAIRRSSCRLASQRIPLGHGWRGMRLASTEKFGAPLHSA